jgi:hypothetical protein
MLRNWALTSSSGVWVAAVDVAGLALTDGSVAGSRTATCLSPPTSPPLEIVVDAKEVEEVEVVSRGTDDVDMVLHTPGV